MPLMLATPVNGCADCPLNSNGRCPFVSKKLSAGSSLWNQGDVPRDVVFVKDGLISVTSADAMGHEVMSAVRGPRSLVGFEALRVQPSRGTVDAITDAQVCTADAAAVRQWAGLDGGTSAREAAVSASSLLTLALDELDRMVRDIDLRSGPALSRVARFLLASSKLIDAGRQAPFSKQHVAQLIGIRAETMSRCLKKLQTAGIIESGRAVRIRDPERLAEVARGAA
jgi:CRP-like cAMP-binding protein